MDGTGGCRRHTLVARRNTDGVEKMGVESVYRVSAEVIVTSVLSLN